ncbi:MAG: hypothetical protein JO105_06510 [Hyphomicrobiales bacterium]|nr:hypothetical protein [Hyphomicrobiales bacterium]
MNPTIIGREGRRSSIRSKVEAQWCASLSLCKPEPRIPAPATRGTKSRPSRILRKERSVFRQDDALDAALQETRTFADWADRGRVSPEKALFVTPDDQKGCCGLLLGELACEKACFQETGWRRFGAF